MAKPKFDPSQPFEIPQAAAGAKPKFDPGQPFEVPSAAETQGARPPTQATSDNWFGPGGKVPTYLANSPNARALVEGTLEQLPAAGGIAGGAVGASAGLAESAPTFGLTAPVLVTAQGIAGAGLGTGAGKALENMGREYILGEQKTNAQRMSEPVRAAGTGAALQGAADVAGPIINAGGRAILGVGKRAMTSIFGPSGEAIETYLSRADQIKNAKSIEQIKDQIDHTMSGMFDAVDKAKLGKEEAKRVLDATEQRIREATQDAKFQFRIKQADISDALKQSRDALDRAYGREVEKLSSIKSPIQLVDDVRGAIADLKDQVARGSKESYEILDKDSRAYSVQNAASVLRKIADDMNIQAYKIPENSPGSVFKSGYLGQTPEMAGVGNPNAGKVIGSPSAPVTSQARGIQAEIRAFADRLEQTPKAVPARELKKILQDLDDSNMAMYGQPGFDSRLSRVYKLVRGTIDDAVKQSNPAYAEKMSSVAKNTQLLDEAIGRFGDSRSAASRLNSIASRANGADRDLLERLGSATGNDFRTPVEEYLGAQAKLKTPSSMADIKSSLPEYSSVRDLERRSAGLSRPESAPEYVSAELKKSGLTSERAFAEKGVNATGDRLTKAERALEPFKTLTQSGSENAVRGLMRKPEMQNIELKRKLEDLSNVSGKDFVTWIKDRRIANQFEGEYRNGSRNAVMFGTMGAAVGGSLAGPTGATVGATIGTSTGGAIDRFGPKIAQKILDAVRWSKGPQIVSAIDRLDIPPEAKRAALLELSAFAERPPAVSSVYSKAADNKELDRDSSTPAMDKVSNPSSAAAPTKGPTKWANDGFEKLSQHGAGGLDREALMNDPKARELLIQASDLKPGSKAMDSVLSKIKARAAKGGE